MESMCGTVWIAASSTYAASKLTPKLIRDLLFADDAALQRITSCFAETSSLFGLEGWSDLATDRSAWRCRIQEATTKFEEERITAANKKRLRRDNPTQTPTPHPRRHCSRICRARIGLISHERACRQRHGQPP
ncbi:hypothetical protein ElyMa_004554200 [Elysia marginata]|uniref:Uncharacterized protein n=1 Tax=Elysia marginata TaxID=1093978 RepID=A0AAV4HRN9_9GAST|nr:hypothetical protein ElyMa_004554200 [Elysia marginata]